MIRRSAVAQTVAIVPIVLIAAACTSAEPPSADPDEANAALTLEYIAHASFLVTGPDEARVLLDPYASRVWLGYDFLPHSPAITPPGTIP